MRLSWATHDIQKRSSDPLNFAIIVCVNWIIIGFWSLARVCNVRLYTGFDMDGHICIIGPWSCITQNLKCVFALHMHAQGPMIHMSFSLPCLDKIIQKQLIIQLLSTILIMHIAWECNMDKNVLVEILLCMHTSILVTYDILSCWMFEWINHINVKHLWKLLIFT